MKKIFIGAMFATFLLCYSHADAKIRRVGYFGIPIAGTDYADLQSAQDSANVSDTIMLYPGSWNADISKKIVVLGYGYFLTGRRANNDLQTITGSLDVTISLHVGADSSVYEGIDGLTISFYSGETVNKVIIRRCNAFVYLNDKIIDNLQISQSNINNLSNQSSEGKVTNLKVDNCYIGYLNLQSNDSDQSGQFSNDIISSDNTQEFGNGAFLIRNCILLLNHGADFNCVYQNCIGNSDYSPIPAGNGNQNIDNAAMLENVFVGYGSQGAYSSDARWALKDGSPAKAAGTGGTDCGIFGGNNPYKLSGIPKIPSFYKLSSTSNTTGSNPYTITFSVRSNN